MLFAAVVLSGCTFGAPSARITPNTVAAAASVVTVDVNLTLNPMQAIAPGIAGGFRPVSVTIPVGTFVRFVNSDGFSHTATSIAMPSFPAASPFDASALTARGDRLSTGFTSGTLVAGAASQTLLADSPGTYLYGCFFHYGAPMRAEIIVQ